jgi:DNA-binding transcriptional MocR family regulator
VEQTQSSGQSPRLRQWAEAKRCAAATRLRAYQRDKANVYVSLHQACLSKETKAKRGEVAGAEARNRQRDAGLRGGSDKHSTLRSLS